MKFKALLDNQEHDLLIDEVEGRLRVQIDDRSYDLEVYDSEDTAYLLVNDKRIYDCRVIARHKSGDRFAVSVKGNDRSITIVDPRRLRPDENSDRHHHGSTEITAQMPGKVVRVLVDAGATVDKGAGVVIVEAMKMQNEMKTPRAGIVISVNVAAGDTVNAGDVLATVGD